MKSAELFEIASKLQKAEVKTQDPSLRVAKELVRKAAWAAWRKEKGK